VICCFLLDDLLIDCGPASCVPALLEELGDTPPRVLALTHIHLDHAGAAGTLVERWPDLEVWVHERGAPHLIDPRRLLDSAERLYGEDMQRLWGEVLPVPAANIRVLHGGESWTASMLPTPRAMPPTTSATGIRRARPRSSATLPGVRVAPSSYVLAPTPPP